MNLPENGYYIRSANNWVDETDVEELRAIIHPRGATVFAKIGEALTQERRRFLLRETVVDNNMMSAQARSETDDRFLFYLLSSLRLREIASGTALPYLNFGTIAELRVRVPPLPEQRAIAAVLGALDDKIDLNRRMNETLEAMARALFKSWFIDFDPVRAKAEGRQPAGMDAETAALFPSEFEGELPKGWTGEPVGELVEVVGGATPSTERPDFWTGGHHCWATPKDLSRLSTPVLLDTERRITDAGLANISSGLLPAGVLLLSSRAPIGYLAISEVPVAVNQGFIAMVCKEKVSNYFMLQWCRANMSEIEQRASGTTFPEISKRNFRPMPVFMPSAELLQVFDSAVAPLHQRIVASEREIRTLAGLRDLMLPKLMSGEIRVEDLAVRRLRSPCRGTYHDQRE